MPKLAASRVPAVDAYIAKAADFAQPILAYLREIMHEGAPALEERMKWSRPFFVYKGVILGNISAFKAHCSFGLWGPEIAQYIREQGTAEPEGMGSFGKLTAIENLPSREKLVEYVRVGAKAIDLGGRTKAWSRPKVAKAEVAIPDALASALKKNKAAGKRFEAMPPGCQREYCLWIAEAKREETRERRLASALEWIAQGKTRNWKYEQPSGG